MKNKKLNVEALESRKLLTTFLYIGENYSFHPDVDGDGLPEIVSSDFNGTPESYRLSSDFDKQVHVRDQLVQTFIDGTVPEDFPFPLRIVEFEQNGEVFIDAVYYRDAYRGGADVDGDGISDEVVNTGTIGKAIWLSSSIPNIQYGERDPNAIRLPASLIFETFDTGYSNQIELALYVNANAGSGVSRLGYFATYVPELNEFVFGDRSTELIPGDFLDINADGIEDTISVYGFSDWRVVVGKPEVEPFSETYESPQTLEDSDGLERLSNLPGVIAAWVYLDDAQDFTNIVRTLCPQEQEFMCEEFGPEIGIELQINEGQLFGTVTGYRRNIFGHRPIASRTWTHVAMTWDTEGNNTLWIDGEPGEPSTHSSGLSNNPGRWAVGTDPLQLQADDEPDGRMVDQDSRLTGVIFSTGEDFDLTDLMNDRQVSADANANGSVDFADFLLLSASFGTNLPDTDFNRDGTTDFADFLILSSQFRSVG